MKWSFVLALFQALCVVADRPSEAANGTAKSLPEPGQCSQHEACYCIRRDPGCGWCVTYDKAMPGGAEGPKGGALCPRWIGQAKDCGTLHCPSEGEAGWWLSCAAVPTACWVFWLVLYLWREHLRARYLPEAPLNTERILDDFFRTKRTFEAFRKGIDCPPEERLPLNVSRPYELNLSDLSCKPGENYEMSRVGPHRLSVTLRIALQWRTALGATLIDAAGIMLFSSMYIVFLRNAARRMDLLDYQWLILATKELGAILTPLHTAVGMLLSFYALNRIAWYWTVLMQGNLLQGKAHDLGMIGGAVKQDTEEDWATRYQLYRHTMLTFFFSYQPVTPTLRFLPLTSLVSCGLLHPQEVAILQQCHRSPGTVTEGWLANWVVTNLKDQAQQAALEALRELRGAIAVMQALVDQRAPVSFESLLYTVVYALVGILPFSPANIDYSNRQAVMEGSHAATVIGIGILSGFYLALLHMLRHIQAPYDDISSPNDALNPLALMNGTERKLRDYLGMPLSKASCAAIDDRETRG